MSSIVQADRKPYKIYYKRMRSGYVYGVRFSIAIFPHVFISSITTMSNQTIQIVHPVQAILHAQLSGLVIWIFHKLRSKKNHYNNFHSKNNNARDAIRTHEPLQEWILSPSELAGLSYPRMYTGTENCALIS